MVAYGATNQVLTLHLVAIGVSTAAVGWFMTLTLVGDTVILYYLTWHADVWGRRAVMALGCAMMAVLGVVFALLDSFPLLLLAAVVGVISPLGDETGPFKLVEEACIAHLTGVEDRPAVFAVHWMLGTAGVAVGALATGWGLETAVRQGVQLERAYRLVFVGYAVLAVLKGVLVLLLSSRCELESGGAADGHGSSLLEEAEELEVPQDTSLTPLLGDASPTSSLSPTTTALLKKLLTIFMLDSFGYGFMPGAWVVYYFKTVLGYSAAALGSLFFVVSIANLVLLVPSAYLAKHTGLVFAILVTQAPAALCFAAVPLAGSIGASVLLVANAVGSTMDVVPRQMFLTTTIPKHELTKVLGTVNIGKTMARCVGPVFTGRFSEEGLLWLGYEIAAGGIIVSDTLLWWWFYRG